MQANAQQDRHGLRNPWRLARWSAAAALLLAPLLAMQFTDEVKWDAFDFAFAGALVLGVGLAYEMAVRRTLDRAYRAAAAVALGAAFILVWGNAAVGIIGREDNPANRMYAGVLAVAILGSAIARLRPWGMAFAMLATATAQVAVAVIALFAGFGFPGSITAFFAALWLVSAWLFRRAARAQASADAAP